MKLTENVKRIFVVLGTILGIGLMIFFFGRPVIKAVIYIFSLLSPFIFGYIISRLINPLADKLQKKFKLPRVISVIFVIVVTLAILIGIIGGIGYKLITELRSFMVQLPEIIETVKYTWEDFISRWSKLYVDMPDSVQSAMDNIYQGFIVKIRTFASDMKVVDNAQDFAKSLPGGLIWTVIFILSLFFMVSQNDTINEAITKLLGDKVVSKLGEIKSQFRIYLGGYFKAQAILMFVVFVLITMVLSLVGAPYAIVVGAATAVLDALPFLGSGLTLWPLAIGYFVSGNLKLGIAHIAVYIGVLIVRRFLEPKLVSDKMGFNPILTLISMYLGYRWWGIIGMIIGPVLLMVLFSLYRVGLFDRLIKIVKQLFAFATKEIKLFAEYLDNITRF